MRRRSMLLAVTTFLVLALLVSPAAAGRLWCSSDPDVCLDQRFVSISVAVPLESMPVLTGPTAIDITAPPAVEGALVVNDVGFTGHGTIVSFQDAAGASKDDEVIVEVRIRAPIAASAASPREPVPLRVTVMPDKARPVTVPATVTSTVVRLAIQIP